MDAKFKRQMVKQLDRGLASAHDRYDAAARDIQELTRLREALTQVGESSPENPAAKNGSAPLGKGLTTTPLIVTILLDDPKREWSIPAMTEEMRRRGWQSSADDPGRAVASALFSLARDKFATKTARGIYRASAKTKQLVEA